MIPAWRFGRWRVRRGSVAAMIMVLAVACLGGALLWLGLLIMTVLGRAA